ncbi:MAG: hypothetical protein IJP90_00640 [Treponema sp.]|nr:hypothetical protein [Treponema sp.]
MDNRFKKFALSAMALMLTATVANAKPKVDKLESFEKGAGSWTAVKTNWGDGDKSTAVAASSDWASDGKQSLKCSFEPTAGKSKESATFFTEKMAYTDISPYDAISVEVYNPTNSTIQVALALTTGSGWDWFESKEVDIAPGEKKTVRMELYEGSLKAASSNWQYSSDLENSDDLRRVAVKFFIPEGVKETFAYIDNIQMIVE